MFNKLQKLAETSATHAFFFTDSGGDSYLECMQNIINSAKAKDEFVEIFLKDPVELINELKSVNYDFNKLDVIVNKSKNVGSIWD